MIENKIVLEWAKKEIEHINYYLEQVLRKSKVLRWCFWVS